MPPRRAEVIAARPRGQRLRRLPRPDHPARPPLARRGDVGLLRGRRASSRCATSAPTWCRSRPRRRPARRSSRRPCAPGRRSSTIVGPHEAVEPALGRARGHLARTPRLPVGPAAPRRDAAAGRRRRPAGAAYPQGRGGRALPRLRGDVHRGGRHLPGGRRRRRPLPRAGQPAGQPRLVVLPDRGRPGAVQGRGRLRDAVRLPDPGGVRRPGVPRPGPRQRRDGRGGRDLPARRRADRLALRQRAQPGRAGGVRAGWASSRPARSPRSCSEAAPQSAAAHASPHPRRPRPRRDPRLLRA